MRWRLGADGTAYYTSGTAGQRVRKVWEHSGLIEERLYLGGWEVYRKRDSLGNLLVERETLHADAAHRSNAPGAVRITGATAGARFPSGVQRKRQPRWGRLLPIRQAPSRFPSRGPTK